MRHYRAKVVAADDLWMIYVPEIDRSTETDRRDEIEEKAREMIAFEEGIEPKSFSLALVEGD